MFSNYYKAIRKAIKCQMSINTYLSVQICILNHRKHLKLYDNLGRHKEAYQEAYFLIAYQALGLSLA